MTLTPLPPSTDHPLRGRAVFSAAALAAGILQILLTIPLSFLWLVLLLAFDSCAYGANCDGALAAWTLTGVALAANMVAGISLVSAARGRRVGRSRRVLACLSAAAVLALAGAATWFTLAMPG